jgi:hypothetical protein
MTYILPDATTANADSNATLAAHTATANAAFIAYATVLINNAVSNGIFRVEPYIAPFMNITTITTYFQGLGYTVLFPIVPPAPFNDLFGGLAAGFPEVVPPGWYPWGFPCNCGGNCGGNCGAPRISISWPPFPVIPPFP